MSIMTDVEMDGAKNMNNNSATQAKQPLSPGKHKKDYVYKFWMALHTRCAPIIKEFNQSLNNDNEFTTDNENSNDISMNSDNNDNNNKDDMKIDETDTNEMNEHSENEDVSMKDGSITAEPEPPVKKGLTFEKLGAFMSNKQLIMLVAKYWSVLKAYINNEAIKKESIKDARIILTTLMISMFPHDVLDVADVKDMDALSEGCFNAAQKVVKIVFDKDPTSFHPQTAANTFANKMDDSSNNSSNDSNSSNQTKFYCEQAYKSVIEFFNAFNDWQRNDKTKVLDSVLNFYEQWQRSYAVLKVANMNEAQKEAILKTMNANIKNCKKKILRLVGNNESQMLELTNKIDEKLKTESESPNHQHLPNSHLNHTNTNTNTNANANNSHNSNNANNTQTTMSSMANSGNNGNNANNTNNANNGSNNSSIEAQLKARGVPVNMKTGTNLLGPNGSKMEEKSNNDNDNESSAVSGDIKYMTEDENGNKVLNLDAIIMEEASKKYWLDFEKEIEKENWSKLFELLSELLERIKTLSPKKTHKMLDDLIDVSFIQQTIQNGTLDASGFYGIFHGIWKQLRSLHAPAKDAAWDAWHDKILKDMGATDATWAKLLSQVFNTFLLKVDEIEDQVNAINAIREKKKQETK